MLHISSRHNALYKHTRRLSHDGPLPVAKGASASENSAPAIQFVLEGRHLCQDWLRHHGQPQHAFFDEQRLQSVPELHQLMARLDRRCVATLDSALLRSLSTIAHAQGVLFVVEQTLPVFPSRIDQGCIWLDRVQDPGNVGTLLRTAAAAGVTHAYLSPQCAAAWSPRVLRSAQGAHFVMMIHEQVDLCEAVRRLDVPLFATALDDDSVSLFECDLPASCAWLFGNEGQGITPELLARADQRVHIPQSASVESLNVGVAAGICLFEQRRRYSVGARSE